MLTFVDDFVKSIMENIFRVNASSFTGSSVIWIISCLLKLELIGAILMGIALLFDKLILHRKKKHEQCEMQLEDFIPEDFKRMSAKCSNCGASVPLQTNGQFTMSCPFCSGPIELSKTIIDQAIEARKQKEANELRIKELEDKKRDQELEKERLAIERSKHTKKIFLIILATIGTIAWIVIMVLASKH